MNRLSNGQLRTVGGRLFLILQRWSPVVFLLILLLSMLPALYVGLFDYATGDDLLYGAVIREALRNHGSLTDCVRAVWNDILHEYYTSEGRLMVGILWRLEPSIISERFYTVTPFIAVGSFLAGNYFFLSGILKKRFGLSAPVFLMIWCVLCFISIQFMPYPRGGIYWFTGMIHYTFTYGLELLLCAGSLRILERYQIVRRWSGGMILLLVLITIGAVFTGGSGYPEALLFPILMCALLHDFRVNSERMPAEKNRLLRPEIALLIPVLADVILLIIDAAAPGNRSRTVNGDTSFTVPRVIAVLAGCAAELVRDGVRYFLSVRVLLPAVMVIVTLAWFGMKQNGKKETCCRFRHPVLFGVLCFISAAIVRAPVIFAGGEAVKAGISGGVYDSYFFVFVLGLTLWCVYLTGFVKGRLRDGTHSVRFGRWLMGLSAAGMMVCIVGWRHVVGNSLDYICVQYVSSGQLADFRDQMEERLTILNSAEKDVELPPINDEQGPLMHMPVTADPTAYTNMVTARFYGKDSVVVREDS